MSKHLAKLKPTIAIVRALMSGGTRFTAWVDSTTRPTGLSMPSQLRRHGWGSVQKPIIS